jgi:hypothetical protein
VLTSSRTALLRQDRYGDGNQPHAEVDEEEDVRRCWGKGIDIAELPGRDVISQAAEYEDVVEAVESWLSDRIMAVDVCLEEAAVGCTGMLSESVFEVGDVKK